VGLIDKNTGEVISHYFGKLNRQQEEEEEQEEIIRESAARKYRIVK
jgi:hypothetical protein